MFNRMMTGSIGVSVTVIINTPQTDWNVIDDVYGGLTPTSSVKLIIINNSVIRSSSPSIPAFDLRGLPSGSTVRLVNNGYIIGRGGGGGKGNGAFGFSEEFH